MRSLTAVVLILVAGLALSADPALAQAPPSAPLVLRLPSSPRTAALGNAWVAGRDADVIFYNPAQLVGTRQEFALSVTRYGPSSHMATLSSTFAAGKMSLTLGWGVELLTFAPGTASYPFAPDVVLAAGPSDGVSALVVVGGAVVFKGFRVGASGKYALDRVSPASADAPSPAVNVHAMLADVGMARNLFGGTAAVSMQNLGAATAEHGTAASLPRQLLAGWSATRPAGPLDLGLFGQITVRDGWTSPGGGLEVGYSWIDGYNVALRVGARRMDTPAQHPVSFGAAFTADRLTVEYGVQFFEHGHTANGVTVRWR